MKFAKKHITFFFGLVSAINLLIFFFRDKFAFHKYGTYSSLYSANTGKWKGLPLDYPRSELTEARGILESFKVDDPATSGKVLKIGRLLYTRFHKQLGNSSPLLANASPLQQYKILLSSDTTQLWCGNFAAMFAFFCWSDGIACRVVEIMNPGDHHVVNECYLPEKGEWALADLTNNNLLIWDQQKGEYANLLSLRDSTQQTLSALRSTDSTIVPQPFNSRFYDRYFAEKNPIDYYYRINNVAIYKTGEKIKRYFFAKPWYEELNPDAKRNLSFYIKQLFILLWLISFALVIKKLMFKTGE